MEGERERKGNKEKKRNVERGRERKREGQKKVEGWEGVMTASLSAASLFPGRFVGKRRPDLEQGVIKDRKHYKGKVLALECVQNCVRVCV